MEIKENGTTPASLGVDLTRAVARVDISVRTTGANPPDFTLTSVRLYNRNTRGLVATAATLPHLPAAPGTEEGPLVYDENDDLTATALEQAIYAFEAGAGVLAPATGWETNTCLVIGGKFGGVSAPATAPVTYYRVEFASEKSDAPGTYEKLALKRNHLYNVVIQQVNAHGWPDEDNARANLPSNIVVEITAWDESDLNDIVFNDQHRLAVDKSALAFHAEGIAKSLRVKTDYPGGWTVEDLPAWLTLVSTVPAAAAGVQSTLTLAATPDDPGDPNDLPRSGHFYIVAGNLRKEITVTQSLEGEFSLEIDPWELVFYKTPGAEKTLTVTPYPTGSDYTLSFTDPGFTWASSFTFPASITPAAITSIPLQPVANATGNTISKTLLVTLTGPLGQAITRAVTIKQLSWEMIFEAITANPYPTAGGTYTFTVTSGGAWKLEKAAADTWLTLGDESGYHPAVSSYLYTFTLADNSATNTPPRTATITVTSSDPDFPSPTSFTIRQSGTKPYEFSEDGKTLTLFSYFPHGTSLDGMNTTNIPELATSAIATAVENLVIEGEIAPSHTLGINGRRTALSLTKLNNI